ncbi:c-type cytochrome [Ideonella sp. DXS22W]|uniref:C-type cytochrome n=1 Tax=Pseudaquabacterium inlustre TaxID=2984192 RepID=A0ABU9CL16_9BURK
MARRVLACTACHGAEGRAVGSAFVPRIAGKPAGYLYRQMLNFRDGQRRHEGMARLLAPLSNEYLREIAAHFAALDLPWPTPQPGPATPALLAQGEQLVRQGDVARRVPACTACHGAALTGVAPAVPGLLGLPHDYITAQLGAWRAGTRRALAPDCMHDVAARLSPEASAAVAAWLTRQPMPADHRAVAALPAPMPLRCGAAPEAR